MSPGPSSPASHLARASHPDRPPDREPLEALDARCLAQPLDYSLLAGPAAQDDAGQPVAAAGPRRLDDPDAVLPAFEALDLPDVRLDPGRLGLSDRSNHEVWADLRVVAITTAAHPLLGVADPGGLVG